MLLRSPVTVFEFRSGSIILPVAVVRRLSHFGGNAISATHGTHCISHALSRLHTRKSLASNVPLSRNNRLGITLYRHSALLRLPTRLRNSGNSGTVLTITVRCQRRRSVPIILIDGSAGLHVGTSTLKLITRSCRASGISVSSLCANAARIVMPTAAVDRLFDGKRLNLSIPLYPGRTIALISRAGPTRATLTIIRNRDNGLVPLNGLPRTKISQIRPHGHRRHFTFRLLLRSSVSLIALIKQTNAKGALLTVTTKIRGITSRQLCSHLLVTQPVIPVKQSVNCLPKSVARGLGP